MDNDWRDKAACRNYTSDLWFPDLDKRKQFNVGAKLEEKARKICNNECSVRQECYDFAQKMEVNDGIWAGYNVEELARMRQGKPPQRNSYPHQTRFNADRNAAKQALEIAKRIGVIEAARELGTSTYVLHRAWNKHALRERDVG